jgi:hypothetical protein
MSLGALRVKSAQNSSRSVLLATGSLEIVANFPGIGESGDTGLILGEQPRRRSRPDTGSVP